MLILNVGNRLTEFVVAAGHPITGASIGVMGDSSTVRVFPVELQAASQSAVDSFDWSDAAHAAWDAKRAVTDAVTQTMTGMSAANVSDRVTLRYVLTLLNDVREHVGLTRIVEADHLVGLTQAVAFGAGDPLVIP